MSKNLTKKQFERYKELYRLALQRFWESTPFDPRMYLFGEECFEFDSLTGREE